MPTIRYGDLIPQPGTIQVTGLGSQPGPVGGDGWQTVATLPEARLPAGTGRYAVIVTGKIGNVQRSGAQPVRGVVQLALGIMSGAPNPSPIHKQVISVNEQLGNFEGVPFMFVMVQQASPLISDPFFGPTWTNGAGAEFALFGRTYWNGDPAAYAVTFDVTEVSWLWFDMDQIPAGEVLADVFVPSSPQALTNGYAGIHLNTNSPGSAGQKWLHFQAITYAPSPGAFGQLPAPSFQFGHSPTAGAFTGFVPKVGTNGRWGQGRNLGATGASEKPTLSQGCFWYLVRPSGVFLPGVWGRDRHSLAGPSATTVLRSVNLSVRLDNLLDVLVRTDEEVANATCNLSSSIPPFWPTVYVPLERPAAGIVATPVCFVHGIVQTTGLQAYEAALGDNLGAIYDFIDSCAQSDAGRQEGCSAMSFSEHGLPAVAGAIQYRAWFMGGFNSPAVALPVRDITIVQFNLVRDPDVVPNIPPSDVAPFVLVPGRESANPASLSPLPIAPDSEMPEDPSVDIAGIEGATGYVRRWPLDAKVRRWWTLTWSSLSEANRNALATFLETNPAFRFTPLRRTAAIALLALDAPELDQVGGQRYVARLRCVELVWTGP